MSTTTTDDRAEPVGDAPAAGVVVDEALATSLVKQARAQDLSLIDPGGLFGMLTKMVLEQALAGEPDDHLGYDAVKLPVRVASRPSRARLATTAAGDRSLQPAVVLMPAGELPDLRDLQVPHRDEPRTHI
ncbi:hypothetical protein [Candidatus Protofrankia californiensis]|uniref:hypothetical protein n=1 Tax=Candidatus Protofrankia californiensis TaxID=1839754 RepID=UPI00104186BA|nr:hypothetical protein [Candidatus Protofrankia californiensis]